MYRLLIVDDEDFEREGMAQLIDWEQQEVEITGTAWNGLDALEQIKKCRPDMILTDIKMPVMDGIELIHEVRKAYPEIQFAVLSGYGEYEFTSRAMEEGVRHYILKPCDEDKILEVMDKVKRDVDQVRENARREKEYHNSVMPKARKQLFQNLLLNREQGNAERLFQGQAEEVPEKVRILTFRNRDSFDGLEEFVLENILDELLDKRQIKRYLTTVIQKDAVLLVSDADPKIFIPMISKISRVFQKLRETPIQAALSNAGSIRDLFQLYRQTDELFVMEAKASKEKLLYYGMFDGEKQNRELLVDFDVLKQSSSYPEILQSLQITFLRMQKRGYSFSEKRDSMKWLLHMLGWTEEEIPYEEKDSQILMTETADIIYQKKTENTEIIREGLRYQEILREVYQNFQNPELSLQYLASEVLFCNEDYLGRFFQKINGQKFTSYIQQIKISVACRLLELEPDCKVGELSEMLGYAADGQYFSRIFKKITGVKPSEYRGKDLG